VKVLDFGISKALLHPGADGTLTTASSFVGSAVYSPPEQLVAAHDVDARADIWSLGTILFEALSGRPPYVGESMMQVASKIFHEAPTPLSDLRPELEPDLVAAVMKCLAKKPEDRFADVRALADALVPFAPSASISAERVARIVSGSSAAMLARPSSHSGATSSVVATRARNRWPLLAVAVAVAGVAVGWLVFATRSPPAPAAAAPSPRELVTTVPLALPLPSASAPVDVPEGAATAIASASASSSALPARPPAVPPKKSPLSVGVK
jgi:eukaryotic-like serine/threonine-protein kinase